GVVGLTTAIRIQEDAGHSVTIVAETLPTDPKSIQYTSAWAGAHHVGSGGDVDERQQKLNQETFDVMWSLSSPGSPTETLFLRIKQTEYYAHESFEPHALQWMPDFERVSQHALPQGIRSGVSFTTVTIDVPAYLNYLHSRFLGGGGKILRASIEHVDDIAAGKPLGDGRVPDSVDAIVVCAGLSARTLSSVSDAAVYPVRGQTVLLQSPWVRFGISRDDDESVRTYTIPRNNGNVIIGGTREPNDWHATPRPETTTGILRRCLALCPELAPPDVRAQRTPTVEDLRPLIIEEGCGLRPARTGGIRLEVERRRTADGGAKVPVIFNYGHGGEGYQSSWGSASVVLGLLRDAFAGAWSKHNAMDSSMGAK
ncbi:hypothetical protein PLICRDRAFT_104635, partial [Plicaturopsis crispa FD-325 SS-3]